MNDLGYRLIRLKRIKDAIVVFKQNTVDFPDSIQHLGQSGGRLHA